MGQPISFDTSVLQCTRTHHTEFSIVVMHAAGFRSRLLTEPCSVEILEGALGKASSSSQLMWFRCSVLNENADCVLCGIQEKHLVHHSKCGLRRCLDKMLYASTCCPHRIVSVTDLGHIGGTRLASVVSSLPVIFYQHCTVLALEVWRYPMIYDRTEACVAYVDQTYTPRVQIRVNDE